MTTLAPRPGFDPAKLNWGGPDEPVSDTCSYCGDAIPEDSVPLRMWNKAGWAVVFCDTCTETWWGMQSFAANRPRPRHEPEVRKVKKRGGKQQAEIRAIRDMLVERFPATFKPKGAPKLPLKIGIHKDLRVRVTDLSARAIERAIVDYTRGPTYLRALEEGAPRFDLDGVAVGTVTASQAEIAKARLVPIEADMERVRRQREAAGG